MAAPSRILALFVEPDQTYSLKYIETETNPSTGPSLPEAASSSGQKVDDLCQILFPKYLDFSDPGSKKHGLPINQPKCPREWDAESWDNRYMRGSANIHIFFTGENRRKSFVLKVSDTTDPNGKLFYEDFDPASRALAPALMALNFMASSHLEWQKSFIASLVPREGGEPDVVD